MDAQDKIEFKLTRDSQDAEVNLREMTLEAAEAFRVLLTCALSIIEASSSKTPDLTISIRKGSAMIVTEGAKKDITHIRKQFENVVEKRASNVKLIQGWRDLQKLVKKNGLAYELNFFIDNEKEALVEKLKSSKKFSKKRQFVKAESNVEFIQGKLIEVGGKRPNIHVEDSKGKKLTIHCTEKSAKKANHFLYDNINLSVWVITKGNEVQYELCDSYFPKDLDYYRKFQEFIIQYRQLAIVAALKKLHYECRWYLDRNNYGYLRKFLKLFIHEKTDINVFKTILILLQSFRENEILGSSIQKIQELFDQQLTAIKKKKNG